MSASSYETWSPCPPGEFERLAQRVRRRRQRRVFLRATGAVAAAVVGGGAVGLWLRPNAAPAPLNCSEVKALADDYGKGRLNDAVRRQVQEHLARCVPCADDYRTWGLTDRSPGNGSEAVHVARVPSANNLGTADARR